MYTKLLRYSIDFVNLLFFSNSVNIRFQFLENPQNQRKIELTAYRSELMILGVIIENFEVLT